MGDEFDSRQGLPRQVALSKQPFRTDAAFLRFSINTDSE
jgi:hypothetical protein